MPYTSTKERLDARLAKQASGLKHIKAPTGVEFTVTVDFDKKIEKAAMKDPLLIAGFDAAARDTADRFVEFVGLKMKATEQLVQKALEANKQADIDAAQKKMNADIEQMRGSAQLFGAQQVQRVWDDLAKKKKEYTKYKIKIGVTIGAAAASLVTSIALMATSAWTGGASAALSIIGMIKSAGIIAKEISLAAVEVEKVAVALNNQLKVVETVWKSKVAGHANEVTGSLIGQFIGQTQPTIKSCDDLLGRCEAKVTGIIVNTHKLSKQIEQMKVGMSKLHTDFMAEAKKRLEKHPSGKGAAQLAVVQKQYFAAVEGVEADIINARQKVNQQLDRAVKMGQTVKALKVRVDTLKGNRGVAYKLLETALLGFDLATSPLSGNGVASSFGEMAGTFGAAAASLAIDRIAKRAFDGTFLEG
jgi:hypothetical protein